MQYFALLPEEFRVPCTAILNPGLHIQSRQFSSLFICKTKRKEQYNNDSTEKQKTRKLLKDSITAKELAYLG